MDKETLKYIAMIVALVVAAILSILLYRSCRHQEPQPVTTTDTVYVTDSVEVVQWKEKTKILHHYDTALLTCIDTVIDSIPVQIPIHQYNYDTITPDSVAMQAEITGYDVQFQRLKLQYVREEVTTTIVQPQKPKRWGLGFQAGFGGGYDVISKQPMLGVYVGIGISYNFLSF